MINGYYLLILLHISMPTTSTTGQIPKPTLELLNQTNVRHNVSIVNNSRVFSALVAGVVTGISGVTGYVGFLFFIISQIMNAALLYIVSCKGQPRKFFSSPMRMFLSGILSQAEILTFILLWTFTNNLVYLF